MVFPNHLINQFVPLLWLLLHQWRRWLTEYSMILFFNWKGSLSQLVARKQTGHSQGQSWGYLATSAKKKKQKLLANIGRSIELFGIAFLGRRFTQTSMAMAGHTSRSDDSQGHGCKQLNSVNSKCRSHVTCIQVNFAPSGQRPDLYPWKL